MKLFTTFYIGETFFGIEILQVKEINNLNRYTFVPDCPDYIIGLLNLRGQIITIFDLAKRIGLSKTEQGKNTRNVILKTDDETRKHRDDKLLKQRLGNDPVGFMVDRVGDVVEIKDEQIVKAPANITDIAKEFISGVVELEKELLIILNLAEVVGYKEARNV